MKQSLQIYSRTTQLALVLTLALLVVDPVAAANDPVSIDDIRFASLIGIPVFSSANPSPSSSPLSMAEFRGISGQSCASLDFNTFLHRFDPHELLAELRQSLLSGAQSEISNYLVALAYSAPTLVSVLEMTDRQVAARFNALRRPAPASRCEPPACRTQSAALPGHPSSVSRARSLAALRLLTPTVSAALPATSTI